MPPPRPKQSMPPKHRRQGLPSVRPAAQASRQGSCQGRGDTLSEIGRGLRIEDIAAAERLMGVTYTPEERAQMLENLEGQIASAQARRTVRLDNTVPMASRFDPRLPGFTLAHGQDLLRPAPSAGSPLPEADEDIAFATLAELAPWIVSGELTSRRLTEIYLDRIAALNPKLECFVTVCDAAARAEADAADALTRAGVSLGPLHGIPYGLKDLFDTKGVATGWGAEPFRDRVPDRDAAVTRLLRQAGAVLLGKTSVGALAYNDIWYGGRTRNPWNTDEGSSGSSAGSASATAAGLCAFAIGTETLGSITSPSQRCGTTGLRPTFGRVSRAGGDGAVLVARQGRSDLPRGGGYRPRPCRAERRRPGGPVEHRRAVPLRRHRRHRRPARGLPARGLRRRARRRWITPRSTRCAASAWT